jgi:hypothetical protein
LQNTLLFRGESLFAGKRYCSVKNYFSLDGRGQKEIYDAFGPLHSCAAVSCQKKKKKKSREFQICKGSRELTDKGSRELSNNSTDKGSREFQICVRKLWGGVACVLGDDG